MKYFITSVLFILFGSSLFAQNNCLDFDGTDDYVSIPSNSIFDINQNVTVEAWVKLDDFNAERPIVTRVGSSFYLYASPPSPSGASKAGFYLEGVSSGWLVSTTSIDDGVWHHIAGTYNGSMLKIFVDGVAEDSVAASGTIPNSAIEVKIGKRNTELFLGKIDEVRIWNSTRTETEIIENMCKSLDGDKGGLVAYYQMNETTGTNVPDISGNGNPGTLTNMDDNDWVASNAYNTWLDVANSTWTTATNWSLGHAPTSSDNVGIPNHGSSHPELTSNIECHNLVVGDGVTLDCKSGSHTIHGSVFNIGTTNLDANTDLTITGSLYMLHHSHFNIKPLADLTIDKNLHTEIWGLEGYFTIESDNSGTGSLIVGGSSSGDVIFKRHVDEASSKGYTWHYVSSPVAGQNIDNAWMTANSILFNDPAHQLYRFDEDTDYWIYYDYTGTKPEDFGDETFVAARGYAATRTAAGELSFTGTVHTNDVDYPTTYTSDKGVGFNLVGNPFTSSIGVTNSASSTGKFLTVNADLLDDSYQALYIWDEGVGYVYGDNDYKVISNGAIGEYTSLSNNYIQPGQAFMVKVASDASDYSLAFNKNMQAHSNDAYYKQDKEIWPSIELIVQNDELSNTAAIGFNENMTLGLDPSYDAGKLKGNPNIALYTRLVEDNGHDFAIQALPEKSMEASIIPVGIDVAKATEMTFSIYQEGMEDTDIRLEDRQNGIFTDLHSKEYTTQVSESGIGRFFLHIGNTTSVEETKLNNIQAYVAGNNIIIQSEQQIQHITLTDITGRTLGVWESIESIPAPKTAGIYFISIVVEGQRITEKIIVN